MKLVKFIYSKLIDCQSGVLFLALKPAFNETPAWIIFKMYLQKCIE